MTRKDLTKQYNAVLSSIILLYYKVTDSTRITHLDKKELMAWIQTKSELTKYLIEKLVQRLKVDYVAIHHKYP